MFHTPAPALGIELRIICCVRRASFGVAAECVCEGGLCASSEEQLFLDSLLVLHLCDAAAAAHTEAAALMSSRVLQLVY